MIDVSEINAVLQELLGAIMKKYPGLVCMGIVAIEDLPEAGAYHSHIQARGQSADMMLTRALINFASQTLENEVGSMQPPEYVHPNQGGPDDGTKH